MLAPVGTAHVYVVAPLTLEMEYATLVCPWHTVARPLMLPAGPTPVTVTPKLLDAPAQPLALAGVTLTLPETAEQL